MQKAYPVVFTKRDKRKRLILIPNLSPGFGIISGSVLRRAGYKCQVLPLADGRAKELGKKYVHNDMCYPAQINIGECLRYIEDNKENADNLAVATAKNCEDCRAGQYSALARKALDDSGNRGIPIVTTGFDTKKMHPGFSFNWVSSLRLLFATRILDALESMRLSIRPYELQKGETDRVFTDQLNGIAETIEKRSFRLFREFKNAVKAFEKIPMDLSRRRPRVLVIGEILMNHHDSANMNIVRYLEANGMEVILPNLVSFFERQVINVKESLKKNLLEHKIFELIIVKCKEFAYNLSNIIVDRLMRKSKFYTPAAKIESLAENIDGLIDRTHTAGEGWLLLSEIIEHAKRGILSFVIVQPFGCLPNQVSGKAIIPTVKRLYPKVRIVSIDYDTDIRDAQIENRLQMLIMASRDRQGYT